MKDLLKFAAVFGALLFAIGTIANAQVIYDSGGIPARPVTAFSVLPEVVSPSSFTRPADTTPYAAGDLIANNTLAGSVVDPSFPIPATGAIIPRIRLRTNATTGWATTLNIRLWGVSPTYTNGDNGAYAVATGAAGRLAQFSCTLEQFGDGASGTCAPTVGTAAFIRAGTSVWWDLSTTAAVTPISGQTFTIVPEIVQ